MNGWKMPSQVAASPLPALTALPPLFPLLMRSKLSKAHSLLLLAIPLCLKLPVFPVLPLI
jgi:hypothetical protein